MEEKAVIEVFTEMLLNMEAGVGLAVQITTMKMVGMPEVLYMERVEEVREEVVIPLADLLEGMADLGVLTFMVT